MPLCPNVSLPAAIEGSPFSLQQPGGIPGPLPSSQLHEESQPVDLRVRVPAMSSLGAGGTNQRIALLPRPERRDGDPE